MDIVISFKLLLTYYVLFSSLKVSTANDSIGVSQSLSDGKTLVSQGGTFELGFFTPGNSHKHYLGIWYKNIPVQTFVWVANRVNPINGSSGISLTLNSTGNLELTQNNSVVWYTTTRKLAQNPIAELLDSGNLVVRNDGDADSQDYLWQSFDYPSDTYLSGMKMGRDLKNGFDWRLTSWKSPDDPSPGELWWGLVPSDYPEFSMMNGTRKFSRIGPWNGLYFSGLPDQKFDPAFQFSYVGNKDEIFYMTSFSKDSVPSIVVINQTSRILNRYVWVENDQNWNIFQPLPSDVCDNYGLCGANGYCTASESPMCQCFKGFSPKSPKAWNSSNWAQGCVHNVPLRCNDTSTNDGFVKYAGLKVPDTAHTRVNENINLEQCQALCLKNCSCMAYTNSNISGKGSGCVMWFGDLIDIKKFQSRGQDLYIRMPASELELLQHGDRKKVIIAIIIAAICGALLLCTCVIYMLRRNIAFKSMNEDEIETHIEDVDLPLFDLRTITTATNHFSIQNKIGQGGFGPVYKGKLADEQEIAVKRLSRSSGQGTIEFINEVKLIAKLQHRNLVRLLGCCIQGEEKLLIYEYMANGSLDSFIFDPIKDKLLNWQQRFRVIFGIARGLMYLHQDSRLRIIHRDLKASNVLLDNKFNPKISDFGMAKAFGEDQIEGNTNRVVGTYGYMAPEYAINGLFSIKSDVFSFGILMLEIISGRKNRTLNHANNTYDLVGYAWTLWKEGNGLQVIDENIKESCNDSEVLRCIHVSLICVQQNPEDRPTMTSVLRMLESEMDLVDPKEPGFFPRKDSNEVTFISDQDGVNSNNGVTITFLNGR